MKKYLPVKTDAYKGLIISFCVLIIWGVSLYLLLVFPMSDYPGLIFPLILWQTFLYTGLFITAHDAMHGIVFHLNKKLNNAIGSFAVFVYAIFSFKRLLKKHWEHHDHPASEEDPDFHNGKDKSFWAWYSHFMYGYITWRQILGMAIAFNVLKYIFNVQVENLLMFWVLPSILSTLQLFYFGTFLPHREAAGGYKDGHHARSNEFTVFWSFITCYHFGYHWEHHEFPYIPWWKLPQVKRELDAKTSSA
jgi:beta-carotene ketolase (CrtW type)